MDPRRINLDPTTGCAGKIRLASTVCDEIPLQMVPAILGILACVCGAPYMVFAHCHHPLCTPLFNGRPFSLSSIKQHHPRHPPKKNKKSERSQLRNISGKVEYVSWRRWQCVKVAWKNIKSIR